ncbi:MAG: hypothetical protein EOP51_19120, partial [Sphingobacteriales bacterium]
MKRTSEYSRLLAKLILVAGLLTTSINSFGQSYNQNFILIRTPKESGVTSLTSVGPGITTDTAALLVNIQYIDGLGRQLQNVQVRGSGTGKDLIQPFEYDAYGRESKRYLPYAATTASMAYRSTATTNDQGAFYSSPPAGVVQTTLPYSITNFEASPLNRVIEQGFPGKTWQPSTTGRIQYKAADGPTKPEIEAAGWTVLTEYTTNTTTAFSATPVTSNPGSRRVTRYKVTIGASNFQRTLGRETGTDKAYYDPNELMVTIIKNENWKGASDGCLNTTEEYKDKEGRVVLKRAYNKIKVSGADQIEMLSTYYVYDDFGNLCFVLPPKSNPDLASGVPSATTLEHVGYQYRYDERQRLALKRIPGKDWELFFYNSLDQIVCTQDANQRNKATSTKPQQASYTKYDALGRVIMTGIMTVPNTVNSTSVSTARTEILTAITALTPKWENANSTMATGYTNISFPTTNSTPLIIDYYDNYGDIPGKPSLYVAPTTASSMTQGLLTASRVAILNSVPNPLANGVLPAMMWTINYYDNKGQVTKQYKQHLKDGVIIEGNYDEITNTYRFTGELNSTERKFYVNGGYRLYIGNEYKYDHVLRRVKVAERITRQITGAIEGTGVYLSKTEFNEIGQVTAKRQHSEDGINYLGQANYGYNERGWIKSITPIGTGGAFAETLKYEKPDDPVTSPPQYNGNISQFNYHGLKSGSVNFKYQYDDLSRLLSAKTGTGLDEVIEYDNNGNITKLTRNTTPTNDYELVYTYANGGVSNTLNTITKEGSAFRSYSGQYDANGNAKTNGEGRTITYNLLNLPETVSYTSNGPKTATYYYDATGKKLATLSTADGSREYIDGIVYKANVIEYIQTEEGRALLPDDPDADDLYYYQYDLKDYLGNVRASFQDSSGVATSRQEDEYYAFGLRRNRLNEDNNRYHLYNGKELMPDLENQYDYSARFYDPVIGRWNVIDPNATKYSGISPYSYVGNNPIIFIDPTGKDLIKVPVPNGNGGVKYAIVDSRIALQAYFFSWFMYRTYGAVITESYRTDDDQKNVKASGGLKAKVGKSRHQQGFALDFGINGAFYKTKGRKATSEEKNAVGEAAEFYSSFSWAYKLRDYPHFELDAKDFGYESFEDAYQTNKEYLEKVGGKDGVPIAHFDYSNPEEESDEQSDGPT